MKLWPLPALLLARRALGFQIDSGTTDEIGQLVVDADDGSLFVAGASRGSMCGQAHAGSRDGWVMKLNADGELQWASQVGTSGRDRAVAVARHGDAVYGLFSTTGEVEEGASSGEDDGAVVAWDAADGSELWRRQFGYATAEFPRALVATDEGVFAVGYSSDASDTACFVFKYSDNGVLAWDVPFGAADMLCTSVAAADGVLYVTGRVEDTEYLDVPSAGGFDAWVFAFDEAVGDLQWATHLGSAEDDTLYSVMPLSDGVRLLAPGFVGSPGAVTGAVALLGVNGTLLATESVASPDGLDVYLNAAVESSEEAGVVLLGGYLEGEAEGDFACEGVRHALLAGWSDDEGIEFLSDPCAVAMRQVTSLALAATGTDVVLAGLNSPEATSVVVDRQPLATAANATAAALAGAWPEDEAWGGTETVQFTAASLPTINEGSGNAVLTVTRTRPAGAAMTCGELSVSVTSAADTARGGQDYETLSETLVFDESTGDELTVTVTIINDEDAERYNLAGDLVNDGIEQFYVRLGAPSTTFQWAARGSVDEARVSIFDTDVPSNTGDSGDVVTQNQGNFAVVALGALIIFIVSCAILATQSTFYRELRAAFRARKDLKQERKRAEQAAHNKELRYEHIKIKAQLKRIEGGMKKEEDLGLGPVPVESGAGEGEAAAEGKEEEDQAVDLEVGKTAQPRCDKCGTEVPPARSTLVVCETCGAVYNQVTGFSTFNRQMAEDTMGPFDRVPAEFRVAPEAVDSAVATIVRRTRDTMLNEDNLPHLVEMVLNHAAVMTYEDGSPLGADGTQQIMQHVLAQVIDELDKLGKVDASASPKRLSRAVSLEVDSGAVGSGSGAGGAGSADGVGEEKEETRPPAGASSSVAPEGGAVQASSKASAKVAPGGLFIEDV